MKIVIVFLLLVCHNVEGTDVITYVSDGDRTFEWAGNKYSITELKNYFIRYRADWINQNFSSKKEMVLFDEGFNLILKAMDSEGFGRNADGSWQNTANVSSSGYANHNIAGNMKKTTNNAIGLAATYLNYIMDNYMHPLQTDNTPSFTSTNTGKAMYTIDNPNKAQVRSYPNINSTVIYSCSSGTKVIVLEQTDNLFWKISVDGYTGYISKNWLTSTAPQISNQNFANNSEEYFQKGVEYARQHQYREAILLFKKALDEGCKNPQLYLWDAVAFIDAGLDSKDLKCFHVAITDLDTYIKQCPTDEYGYYFRGEAKFYINEPTYIQDLKRGGEAGKNFLQEINRQNSIPTNTSKQSTNNTGLKKKANFKID